MHGCFWHQHEGCKKSSRPKTNVDFWDRKLSANLMRDKEVIAEYKKSDWKVLVVWQCQIREFSKNPHFLEKKIMTLEML